MTARLYPNLLSPACCRCGQDLPLQGGTPFESSGQTSFLKWEEIDHYWTLAWQCSEVLLPPTTRTWCQ